jgi:hypothetical protein
MSIIKSIAEAVNKETPSESEMKPIDINPNSIDVMGRV